MPNVLDRTGETNIAKNGLNMTIIEYRNCNDIDIKFEDGVIVYGKQYNNFSNGCIKHPSKKCSRKGQSLASEKYLGKKVRTKDGLVAEVVAYRGIIDADILLEDGTLYKNCHVGKLKDGLKFKGYNSYVGMSKIMNCGQLAEIVAVRRMADIDVKIGETLIKGTTYYKFERGELNTLGLGKNKSSVRVGEKKVMNCGMRAEIIEYKSRKDITIKFDDDTIVPHKRYMDFINGRIQNPNLPKKVSSRKDKKSYVGETAMMRCGLKATIIRSDGYKDIDVEFETGEISYNKRYSNFIRGNISPKSCNSRVGEECMSSCGLNMKIIEYNGCKDIVVEFEDGYIVRNKTYNEFLKGYITHKSLKLICGNPRNNSTVGSFNVLKLAYRLESPKGIHYICQCRECGYKDILTPSEMLKHKCSIL